MRDQYLEAFRRVSAGLRGTNPAALDTDQWWALGRHFGLVTPLLDWTDSLYIAAFFSLSELLSEMWTPSGIVYMVEISVPTAEKERRQWAKAWLKDTLPEHEQPLFDRDRHLPAPDRLGLVNRGEAS